MRFRVLGTLEVLDTNARAIRQDSRLGRLLLAALLSEANRPLHDDHLVQALWGDEWPVLSIDVRHGLREQVHRLRRLLRRATGSSEELIERIHHSYLLKVGPEDLDELVCLRLVEQAHRLRTGGDFDAATDRADRALNLWHGEPLAGLDSRPFLVEYERRLRELRLDAHRQRAAAYLAAGRHSPLVGDLPPLLAQYPDHEALRHSLSLALYRDGRRDEALAVCREGLARLRRRGLISELLQDQERAILADASSLRWTPPRRIVSAGVGPPVPAQLPTDTPHFVGRDAEKTRLLSLLDPETAERTATTVVTIAGRSGVGKTALAVHVGRHLRDHRGCFPDGVLFANLRPPRRSAADPALILGQFLMALGIPRHQIPDELDERAALYRSALDGRRMLVLLDNAADEEQVTPLVPGSPSCVVLVTSVRALTGLDGEHMVLGSLSTQDSLTLLAELTGAQRIMAEADEAREIIKLCDQLPLTLRNAGARLASRPEMSLRRLRTELAAAPLTVLTSGDLEVPGSLSLAYEDLTPPARRAFRLLSVPQTQEIGLLAASALIGVSAEEAEHLVEELAAGQLIERVPTDDYTEPRYRFHDLLRVLAQGRLGGNNSDGPADAREQTEALERMVEAMCACAERAFKLMHPGNITVVPPHRPRRWTPTPSALQRAVGEHPTVWWAREQRDLITLIDQAGDAGFDELVWRLAFAVVDFFDAGGQWTDWEHTHRAALTAARRQQNAVAEANALRLLGRLARQRGDRTTARDMLTQSLRSFTQLGWGVGEASARRFLAELDLDDGRTDAVLGHLERSRQLFLRHDVDFGYAGTVASLGRAHLVAGEVAASLTCYQAAVISFASSGNQIAAEQTRTSLAEVFLRADRIDDATHALKGAEDFFKTHGHRVARADALLLLGDAHGRAGRYSEALAAYDSCLSVCQSLRDRPRQGRVLAHRGRLHAWRGETNAARTSWRQALTLLPRGSGAEKNEIRGWLAGEGPEPPPGTPPIGVRGPLNQHATIAAIARSSHLIRVLTTSTGLLDADWRGPLMAALRDSLGDGARIELLFPAPDSVAPHARRSGAGYETVASLRANLQSLSAFAATLQGRLRRNCVVRLYSGMPTFAYNRCDEHAQAAPLVNGQTSELTTWYELRLDSPFAQFVEQQFDELWGSARRFLPSGIV